MIKWSENIVATEVVHDDGPSIFLDMLDLAGINSAILYKEVTGEKLSRKDYPLSSVAEMPQIFMNAGATSEGTDDDMEFQEVSALKKNENNAK